MKPSALVRTRRELSLSGAALTELLTAVLAKGKAFRFRARGWSMSPFVRDGDVITVSPLRGRRPETGAIVAFVHPGTGRVAVHRIVDAGPGGYLVRGDNTDSADGILPA
jgi:phage repressor protein C with HTH and peptisase S24 domain